MRESYIVYPEAKQALQKCGLEERIKKATKKKNFPQSFGYIYDVSDFIQELRDKKLFNKPPKEFFGEYKSKLEAFHKGKQRGWTVEKPGGKVEEGAENEDFLMMCGYLAAHVLKPSEFWKPEKFGFSSHWDFWGTIGATAWNLTSLTNWREGYIWESVRPDGTKFKSQVTGDGNGDFRMFRTDLTPYPTKDPCGNEVRYRPMLRADKDVLAGYHSYEPVMLAIAIKYAEQQKISAQVLSEKGRAKLIKEVSTLGSRIGNFADAGHSTSNVQMYFICHDVPIPKLDEKNCTTEWSTDRIGTTSKGTYGTYILQDGSLGFAYEEDPRNPKKEIRFSIPPDELDHVVKGLFVQCAEGLGRTIVGGLVQTLKYRFSKEYEEDLERVKADAERIRKKD